jgi:ferrochelatase
MDGTRRLVAVLLLNLGGPENLEAIKPFLYNLFSDRDIIRLPLGFLLQKPLAKLISIMRASKVVKYYEMIGGGSPILRLTYAQARAIEARLNRNATRYRFKTYVGMRYSPPYIEDAVREIVAIEVDELIAMSMFPHYSGATTGSALKKLRQALETCKKTPPLKVIESWPEHPGYVDALVEKITEGLEQFPEEVRPNVHVVFSAHSLPQSFIDKGDPYLKEIKATIGRVTEKLELKHWHLCFQSRSGPVRWLEPTTENILEELIAQDHKELLMVPISFVSDHIETLYEVDIKYKRFAESKGARLVRTASLNDSPKFIDALADLIERQY